MPELPLATVLLAVGGILTVNAAFSFRHHKRQLVFTLGPLGLVSLGAGLGILARDDPTTVAGILAGFVVGVLGLYLADRSKRTPGTASGAR